MFLMKLSPKLSRLLASLLLMMISTISSAELVSLDEIASRYKSLDWWKTALEKDSSPFEKKANLEWEAKFFWWVHNDDDIIRLFHSDINNKGMNADQFLAARLQKGLEKLDVSLADQWYKKIYALHGTNEKCSAFIKRQRTPGKDYVSESAKAKAWLMNALIKQSEKNIQPFVNDPVKDDEYYGLLLMLILETKYGDGASEETFEGILGLTEPNVPIDKACNSYIRFQKVMAEPLPEWFQSERDGLLMYMAQIDIKQMILYYFGGYFTRQ